MKEGWKTQTLGEVAEITAGNSAPQDESLFKNGKYPFFRMADAGRIRFGDIYESTDYLNEEGVKGLRRFPKGTILFPKSGASTFLNHRVMLGVEGYVSSHLATIVADETKVDRRFLLYYLTTVVAQDLIQDHAYPSLNLPTIAGISIPVPPLPEQQRIISILDEAFNGIAKAKANAEKNLQNARELFESKLQRMYDGSSREWEARNIQEICEIGDGNHGGNYPKSTDMRPSGVPFIRSINLVNGEISDEDMRYISEEKHNSLKKGHLKTGDVLFTNRGEIGKSAVVDSRFDDANLNSQIAYFRCSDQVLNWYLYYALQSSNIQNHVTNSQTGAALQQFTIRQIVSLKIPLPPIAEQYAIVAKLDALRAETERLESIYRQNLSALEVLKKSLLREAFNGEL